jgi:hypothetical protein
LLHLMTHSDTHGRTPLDKQSARLKHLYLTTHNIQQNNIPAHRGIRNRNRSKRAAADPHLRLRGHRDRLIYLFLFM